MIIGAFFSCDDLQYHLLTVANKSAIINKMTDNDILRSQPYTLGALS